MKRITLSLATALLVSPAVFAMPAAGYFISANVGQLRAKPGKSAVLLVGQSQLPYSYEDAGTSSSKLNYGIGFGYRMPISDSIVWKVSINYLRTDKYAVNGSVHDASSKLYDYRYQIHSQALLIRDDFVFASQDKTAIWSTLNPYIGVTVGYASNKSDDFTTNAQAGNNNFPGKTKSGFAYGLDAGLSYQINANNAAGVEVQYLDLGNSHLGALNNNTLESKSLKGLGFNLFYNYYF